MMSLEKFEEWAKTQDKDPAWIALTLLEMYREIQKINPVRDSRQISRILADTDFKLFQMHGNITTGDSVIAMKAHSNGQVSK